MKKRKILLPAILSVVLLLSLAACRDSGMQPPENEVLDATEDTGKGIIVSGEPLEGYLPFVDGFDGVILVPLFPIAERLGIAIEWDEAEQRAQVGADISIWVGADYYVRGEGDPVTFGPAPQLIEGTLYVPMYFFQFVVGGYEAHIADGAVVIETKAKN